MTRRRPRSGAKPWVSPDDVERATALRRYLAATRLAKTGGTTAVCGVCGATTYDPRVLDGRVGCGLCLVIDAETNGPTPRERDRASAAAPGVPQT